MIFHLWLWGVLTVLAAQLLVISVLVTTDARRKRCRSQGGFPRSRPTPLEIGDSEVQVYTYGEDLYAAMLHAIQQAQERIVFETFIWKDDAPGQRFKQELQCTAKRGIHCTYAATLVTTARFWWWTAKQPS
jgi:cardiolipin synthase A/B